MDVKDFVDMTANNSFIEEKRNLDSNLKKIDEMVDNNESSIEYNNQEINSIPSNDREYGSYKRDLLTKNSVLQNSIIDLKEVRKKPYFGRMNLTSDNEEIDMYIGEKSITDLKTNQIVYDWRAPVSGLFYQNQEKYKYNGYEYHLNLKRKLSIENSELLKCYDVYSGNSKNKKIVDEFLQKVLENKKGNDNFVDIIKTIQEKQNKMIRDDLNKNVIVQGVAGSGKTVIILHRLSYILFNNPEINPTSFMFIAPTNIFKNKLSDINKKLQIDKITISTLSEYYNDKLGTIFHDKVKVRDDVKIIPWVLKVINDDYSDNEYFIKKYSKNYYKDVISYFDSTFEKEITKFKSIFPFDEKQKEQNVFTYLRYIKIFSEDKIKKYKQECEKQLIDTIIEFQKNLKKQLNYLNPSDDLGKNIDLKSGFDAIFNLINNNINEKLKTINSEAGDLSIYDAKLKDLKVEMHKIYNKINDIVECLNIKRIVFKEEYSEDNFAEAIMQIKEYLNSQSKKSTAKLSSIESNISKKSNSLFKMFYKSSIANLNLEKQTEGILLSKLNINLEKIVKIKSDYNLREMFELYSLYNDKLQKRNSCLNLQKLLINLNQLSKFVNDHNGLMKVDDVIEEIKKCFAMVYFSTSNNVSDEVYNLNDMYEKIDSNLNTIFKIKSEIIDKIETITTSVYIWNLYREYLENSDRLALDNYYSKNKKEISRVDAYLLLRISHELGFLNRKKYNYIYIDEAQDYNDSEIKTIYLIEGKPTLNIYGDINQRIFENVHERKNWNSLIESISINLNQYELNENYRNTIEIVNFCNKKLNLNMNAVGVSVSNVNEYKFESINNVISKAEEMNAIVITNNLDFIKKLEEKNIKCCTVFQSKGLEFTDVIVIDENFNKNQKYVAYTRSLKNLTIFFKGGELL